MVVRSNIDLDQFLNCMSYDTWCIQESMFDGWISDVKQFIELYHLVDLQQYTE